MNIWTHAGTATFDADGRAVAILPGPPPYRQWVVTATTIETTSASRTACAIHKNQIGPTSLVDITPQRSGNANSSTTRIPLRPGDQLIAVWTGGTPGASAVVAWQLEES